MVSVDWNLPGHRGMPCFRPMLSAASDGRCQGWGLSATTLTCDIFMCLAFLITCWLAAKGMCSRERAGQMLYCPLWLITGSHVAPLSPHSLLTKVCPGSWGRSIYQPNSQQARSYYVVRRVCGLGHWLMLDLLQHFPVPFGVQFVSFLSSAGS